MHRIRREKTRRARSSSSTNLPKTSIFSRKTAVSGEGLRPPRSVPEPGDTSIEPSSQAEIGSQNNPSIQDTEGGANQSPHLNVERGHLTIGRQLRSTFLGNWLNVLLIFIPIGIASHFAKLNSSVVFVMNFIAIIPLAGLLSFATEELALRVGDVIGGLLNASFGNAVELIVSIIALIKREVLIVQTSLIGSILSNLLLVLGMAFIVGGYNRIEQEFNTTVAQTSSGLLFVAVGSLIVPTAFHYVSSSNDVGIVQLSRASAVILLLVYVSYLFFQLKSHQSLFTEPSGKNKKRNVFPALSQSRGQETEITPSIPVNSRPVANGTVDRCTEMGDAANGGRVSPEPSDVLDEAEVPELSIFFALLLLATSTTLVAICAEFLVGSIDSLVSTAGISKVFVGLILLPIVGNAAEHYTAVTVAAKDKMDLSISVAVGSSLQIALLVIPFAVILGWGMKIDAMTLFFDVFQVTALFVSVLLVNYLIQDGKSNYLEGNLLIAFYLIIAVAAWFYPDDATTA